MHIFDNAEITELVEAFCATIPGLLAEHSVTADLVPRVVGLAEQAQTPFTVAVVGQMRVGKSSLINAILEKDLVEVGVTETTATINWIRHGSDPNQVRIHWKDKPPETIERSELHKWTGDSPQAENTRYIELFDDAEFLKIASIVDTPGLRSVIEPHGEATANFFGIKRESETRVLGSQADAIIYVLMPVAKESDDDFLAMFSNQTQLPGSTSFNSIAVLHKWETLEADDVTAESKAKAATVAKSLGDVVSAVIPVSAPLAWATVHLSERHWKNILKLGRETHPVLLQKMLGFDQKFQRDTPECAVSREDRVALVSSGLPWPSLKMIISLAANDSITTVEQLCLRVAEVAQVDYLRSEIDRRFFARSRTLKVLSTVAKAWEPCRFAELRLRNQRSKVGEMLASSRNILAQLADRVQYGDDDLVKVKAYVETTQETLQSEHESLDRLLKAVSDQISNLKAIHDDFMGDLSSIEVLGSPSAQGLTGEDRRFLLALFGAYGTSAKERLGTLRQPTSNLIDPVLEKIESFNIKAQRSRGEFKAMFLHAVSRLEQLINHLDPQLTEPSR